MIVWIDAQLSPAIADWLSRTMGVEASAIRDLGLRDADDRHIFFAARAAGAVVMSKDSDFVDLLRRHGAPPQLIWVTCGNTSNARLQEILTQHWLQTAALLIAGEPLVEIGGSA